MDSNVVTNSSPDTPSRDTRFDLIRIVAMLMIIFGHMVFHNIRDIHGFQTDNPSSDLLIDNSVMTFVNYAVCQLLTYCSIIGPNLFMLITGYFLIKPRTIKYAVRKASLLWLDIAFYSVIIYLIFVAAEAAEFKLSSLTTHILPIHSQLYWFMAIYLAVLLLSPFLAKASALSQKDYIILLATLLVLNFAQEGIGYGHLFSGGMSLPFFIFIFLIGGYLRLYEVPVLLKKHSGVFWISICVILTLISVLPHISAEQIDFHIKGMANNSLPLFMSVLCFIWLMNLPVTGSRISQFITGVSPFILAVYLIHEHPLIRKWIWTDLTNPKADISQWWFIPYSIIICLAILLICIGIDYIRRKITPWHHLN